MCTSFLATASSGGALVSRNGEDDDCDEVVDEGCPVCEPRPEQCDGLDDDCDGVIDEGCVD